MWLAAAAWFLLCAFMSSTYFREAMGSQKGFFERPELLLTGIGGLTVATLPLVMAGLVQRYHRRRLRGRLLREREKIERRLARLDAKEGRALPSPRSAPSGAEVARASES